MSTSMIFIAALAAAILRAATPIVFAAMGGLISDLAGTINVALEGMMLVAAFFAVIVSVYAAHWFPGLPPVLLPWLGCIAGVVSAMFMAAILAFFHLEWRGDIIVCGIALNLLAMGLTVFLLVTIVGDKGSTASLNSPALPVLHIPGLSSMPVLDALFNGEARLGHHVLCYIAPLSAVVLAVFLARTRYGTWIRAVGENGEAARSAGIPVKRVQYVALLLSGLLSGLGGVYLSMGYLTLFQAEMTSGRGFLALAAVFLGARRPWGTFAAAFLFGASTVLATQLGALHVPTQLVYMLPPSITILALVIAGARRNKGQGA